MDEEWMLESNIAPWLDAEMLNDTDGEWYCGDDSTYECNECHEWVYFDDYSSDRKLCMSCLDELDAE
jgi:hypothetical protein